MSGEQGQTPGILVYVSIGNSDDKLSQQQWSQFCLRLSTEVRQLVDDVFGEWYSAPDAPYQNMCMGFMVAMHRVESMKAALERMRVEFGQDSIVWAPAVPMFLAGRAE